MNNYIKYVPNVFLAACDEEQAKGNTITMTTKYGAEHEVTVFNYIGKKGDKFCYSVVRTDGFNVQEWAKRLIPREHSYTLTYATKAVKELTDKLKMAQKLWA